MTESTLIATRKSPLALKQTAMVRGYLSEKLTERRFENLELNTKVDERLNWSLEKRGGIGLFTKELEEALIERRAELAIHSAKDMPTVLPEGLAIAGYLSRARVNDVLVHRKDSPNPQIIASSSPRRRVQVALLYPYINRKRPAQPRQPVSRPQQDLPKSVLVKLTPVSARHGRQHGSAKRNQALFHGQSAG